MKKQRLSLSHILLFILLAILLECMQTRVAKAQDTTENRFKVVFVVDASGSINDADPKGLRFEVIDQFANLLMEQGNSLGCVVFDEEIMAREDIVPANSTDDKVPVINLPKDVEAKGDTDISKALTKAMDMLQESENNEENNELPSVIVLLSDGSVDLPNTSQEEVEEEINNVIDRACSEDICIHSICLNASGNAKKDTLATISSKTKGESIVIENESDFRDKISTINYMIYHSLLTTPKTEIVTEECVAHHDIIVPDLSVEEVNIVLSGATKPITEADLELRDPGGTLRKSKPVCNNTFTLVKISSTDITPGKWTLRVRGEPGENIYFYEGYISNLKIHVAVDSIRKENSLDDTFIIWSYLIQNNGNAVPYEKYSDFKAYLDIYSNSNFKNPPYRTFEMINPTKKDTNKGFWANLIDKNPIEAGEYYFSVHIEKRQGDRTMLYRTSDQVGPYVINENICSMNKAANEPPMPKPPIASKIQWVSHWNEPFELDLSTLITDERIEMLDYKVSPDHTNYKIENNKLLKVFGLGIGTSEFEIAAKDEFGERCVIKLTVKRYSLTVLVLLFIFLFFALVIGIYYRWISTRTSGGSISIEAIVPDRPPADRIDEESWKGHLRLSKYKLDDIGIDYRSVYIRATGKGYALLISKVPVQYTGGDKPRKKVRLDSGIPVPVTAVKAGTKSCLELRFDNKG